MKTIKLFFTLIILASFSQHVAAQEETPATPKNRAAPLYPASCLPEDTKNVSQEQVIVMFDVDRDGNTENIRVRETTDPCFNEVAIASVRSWTYEPRRVDNRREAQTDLEVTFTFKWDGETQTQDFDARPIVRVPPAYPERCMARARDTEVIVLEYDVSEEGRTENVHVIDSTNSCLERTAIESVKQWEYIPKLVDGKPVRRPGVQTQITYHLTNSSQIDFRRIVRNKLLRVQSAMKRKKDPQEVLDMLQEIEDEFGDSFSRWEQSAFHQLRAAARIEAKDYAGALDDLRMVQKLGAMSPESAEAVAETIAQLEAIVSAQNAAPSEDVDSGEDVEDVEEAPSEN